LRGFGKLKKRTWYTVSRLTRADYVSIALSTIILAITICVSVFINHSRFFNPFI
jgi:energy-coupling factor transport system permease protein